MSVNVLVVARTVLPLSVTVPVPVVNVFDPATTTLPFNVLIPVDVPNVPEPLKAKVGLVKVFPKTMLVALVSPMLIAAAPDVSSVNAEVPPDLIVNAPESTMLFVVNVCEPITVPVMNVPTPALEMRVVPFKESTPAVIATLPAVAVIFPVVAVNPDEAVTNPEMVGVAVQAVPVTVKLPPNEVRLLPETVKVLSSVVAPCRVKAPGVVTDPMVLIDDAPDPKVLVSDDPVPNVVAPEEVRVVKEPAPPEIAPVPAVKDAKVAAPVPEMEKPLPKIALL